jgi:hypothetical protein
MTSFGIINAPAATSAGAGIPVALQSADWASEKSSSAARGLNPPDVCERLDRYRPLMSSLTCSISFKFRSVVPVLRKGPRRQPRSDGIPGPADLFQLATKHISFSKQMQKYISLAIEFD